MLFEDIQIISIQYISLKSLTHCCQQHVVQQKGYCNYHQNQFPRFSRFMKTSPNFGSRHIFCCFSHLDLLRQDLDLTQKYAASEAANMCSRREVILLIHDGYICFYLPKKQNNILIHTCLLIVMLIQNPLICVFCGGNWLENYITLL